MEKNFYVYENKYGRVEIEVVGSPSPVNSFHAKDIDSDYFFSLEDAEKIALITENRHIQIGFSPKFDGYLLYHSSPSTAALCKVVNVSFGSDFNAREELARPNPFFIY